MTDYQALDPVRQAQVLYTIKLLDGRPPAPLPPLIDLALAVSKEDSNLQSRLAGLRAEVAKLAPLAQADPKGWQLINTMTYDGIASRIIQMLEGATKGDPAAQSTLAKFSRDALKRFSARKP